MQLDINEVYRSRGKNDARCYPNNIELISSSFSWIVNDAVRWMFRARDVIRTVFPFATKFFSGFSTNELVEVQHGWMVHVQEILRRVLMAFVYARHRVILSMHHNNNVSGVIPRVRSGDGRMFTDLTPAFVGGSEAV
ncbi:hypothetical protein H5410_054406 [Solanum commersonii]|uniref:Uncharacterized protein n=1 Tax=Solanum commersonii TaxID=4109 RepID=A0A9J5WH35_SOLCO|nr:hypothetical protein H5410_054406 [Solanum commersonii]